MLRWFRKQGHPSKSAMKLPAEASGTAIPDSMKGLAVKEISAVPQVLASGLCFTESPQWHEGMLWFADMHADKVYSIDEVGQIRTAIDVPGGPNGLGWLPDGRMLVASANQRVIYRLENGGLEVHADLSQIGACDYPLNDMCVAKDGNCYVGECGLEIHAWLAYNIATIQNSDWRLLRSQPLPEACLYRVAPDGTVEQAASGMRFPNGSAITADGRLAVAESIGACISFFTVKQGTLLNRQRVNCDFAPDGLSSPDRHGRIWAADPLGQSISRLSRDGEWELKVSLPRSAFACAVRPDRANTVYICTSPSTDPEANLQLMESCVEVLEVGE